MPETMKEVAAWLGFLGVPSIFMMTGWCIRACISFTRQLRILMTAQQAQMRGQLLEKFYNYKRRGWLTQEELDQWESEYQSYHALGQNGVLDKRRQELFSIPVKQINV